MTDAGFFKGTSAEQDARFADKKKKLMKTMKFGDNLSQKVDMARINLDCIRPWVTNRVTELLNFEDEVVCNYVLNQLEERHPDPKEIQINITGFLNSKNARIFLTELWDLLLSAMDNPDGVPAAFLEAKKTEILKRQEDEQRVQLELRRKEEELRARVSTDQVPTTTTQARSAMQATSDNSGGTTNMESSLRKKSEKNSNSRRSHSSSSPSPRRHNSPKRSDKSRDVDHEVRNHISSRHRRRSSRSSSRSSGVDHGHTKRPLREPRHPRRSRSHDSPERLMKKKPAPDSDWRKDLMAGRRRSPPEMPENSYYGYEKRHKDRKRSRERHRDHRRRDDSGSRHTSPVVEYSDGRGHRKHRETKHHEDFEPDSDDRRRRKHRERFPESRSPSRRRAVDERVAIDRANKYHNRRAQWAQEEDDLSVKQEEPRSGKRIARTTLEVPDKRIRRSPEGPSLPPSRVPNRTVEKDGGSSSSSEESTCSSSDDSRSSEDEPSDAETSSEKLSSGRPTLQSVVVAEPEGPALPPASDEGPEWTDDVNADRTGSSSSSSSSDSQDSEEVSESSDTDTSSSGTSDVSERERSNSTKSRKPVLEKSRDLQSQKRKASPEGPALPPNLTVDHSRRREDCEITRKKSREKIKDGKERDEDMEEALRRRALASLIRASGDRRRPRSP
ncbi:unnamed protein product [Dicrocoelium dendriticum]|nr:unnamed protein product [Dicrocoelium dendriticum]